MMLFPIQSCTTVVDEDALAPEGSTNASSSTRTTNDRSIPLICFTVSLRNLVCPAPPMIGRPYSRCYQRPVPIPTGDNVSEPSKLLDVAGSFGSERRDRSRIGVGLEVLRDPLGFDKDKRVELSTHLIQFCRFHSRRIPAVCLDTFGECTLCGVV